ncbi:MAG: ParA family protein [Gammaproteobacteria bacterium]
MDKILAVTNQKGGVGKTTTSVNLAASLAATKRRVLLIDLDPQGNATMGSGIDKHELAHSVYDVLTRQCTAEQAIVTGLEGGYHVIGANGDLVAAEVELMNAIGRELRLKQALDAVKDRYDYIIIDCAPSLSMLTVNGLVAADGVVIPMQCEYFALEGLAALMDTIDQVTQTVNPKLHVTGILRTMFDPRNTLATDVSAELLAHFPDRVFETIIPRNVRLAEAPAHGMPVLLYDKASRGAMSYLALAAELLRRQDAVRETAPEAV